MKRNFRIASGVELEGEFGSLDVHNAYDLERCEVGLDGRTFCMVFRANEYRPAGSPDEFRLEFSDVSVLEMTLDPEALADFVIHEVGFKEPEDRDHTLWSDDYGFEAATHLVFSSDASSIRVCAESARVSVSEGKAGR